MMNRYVYDDFNEAMANTIGVDFATVKNYRCQSGQKCNVKIWDTCGLERTRSLTKQYVKNADGVIVVYDVTDVETFANVKHWFKHLNDCRSIDELPIVIVGNKIDLENKVIKEDMGRTLSGQLGRNQHLTSAKTGEGVAEMMVDIFEQAYVYCKAQQE